MKPKHHVVAILLAGGALFAGDRLLSPSAGTATVTMAASDRYRIEVTAPIVRALEAGFARRFGAGPDPAQRQTLVAEFVDQEILVREARAYAMGRGDASVRRRLLQKMRAVGGTIGMGTEGLGKDELIRQARELGFDDDLVIRRLLAEKMRLVLRRGRREPPSDAELRRWLEKHSARFSKPGRITLRHCFRKLDGRSGHATEPRAIFAGLTDQSPARARFDCDAFPLASRLPAYTRQRLARSFGDRFADRVFELPVGRWSGPVESIFGLHLVYVEERLEAQLPRLEAVRSRVLHDLLGEQGDQRLAEQMDALRTRYTVKEMPR